MRTKNITLTLFGFLLLSASLGLAGASGSSTFTSYPIVDVGQTQFLIANATGGVAPYTYNFLVYNPSNSLAFIGGNFSGNFIGDIMVVHKTGLVSIYTANANTNTARGQTLINAMNSQNLSVGDIVYLKAESYNAMATITEKDGVQLYGAGKFKTVIVGTGNRAIAPSYNTITSGLTMYGTYGIDGTLWGNSILSNAYVNGTADGILLADSSNGGSLTVENTTISTQYDTVAFDTGGIATNVNIYDSNMIANSQGQTVERGIDVRGSALTMNVVNSIITVGGASQNYGVAVDTTGEYINLYQDSIYTPASGGTIHSLFNNGGSTNAISTNALTTYNGLQTSGTIGKNTLTTYPAYSYRRLPMLPYVFQFSQIAPSGTWTANLIVKDSASNTITNSLTYSVNNAISLSITPANANYDLGQNAVETANWIYTGTPNYAINWSVVGVATAYNAIGQSTSGATVNLITTGGGKTWFCGAGVDALSGGPQDIVATYSADVADSNYYTQIGHQTHNGCQTAGYGDAIAAVAVGVNAPVSVGYTLQGVSANSSAASQTLTYSVSQSNSFVIIIAACGGDNCDNLNGNSGSIVLSQTGCTQNSLQDYGGTETAASYTCPTSGIGTYTVTASQPNADAAYSIAAYTIQPIYTNAIYSVASSTSNSFSVPGLPLGQYSFLASVTDSATVNAVTAASTPLTVNNILSANILLESSSAINIGQSATLTAGATGGTPPYIFNWFTGSGCSAANYYASGITNTVSPATANTYTYSFNVVDSATANGVQCSASNSLVVSVQPTTTIGGGGGGGGGVPVKPGCIPIQNGGEYCPNSKTTSIPATTISPYPKTTIYQAITTSIPIKGVVTSTINISPIKTSTGRNVLEAAIIVIIIIIVALVIISAIFSKRRK